MDARGGYPGGSQDLAVQRTVTLGGGPLSGLQTRFPDNPTGLPYLVVNSALCGFPGALARVCHAGHWPAIPLPEYPRPQAGRESAAGEALPGQGAAYSWSVPYSLSSAWVTW